ncbi:hypothetical protein DICPUDRAFT_147806 [Dictyostelium purpureum]|uniref:Carbohydrate binding domain-containing protein n=1 Tax=Dictyostelium purpureum TaxID=5786 RepID=F0Z9G3_DICPU|nr:uncharacterized protein DICPUDRAFT_147806 [Dictyostelium purpureum]EGC39376.1 hypothetical protein DICPUDRAFT_147806 [Dictyostelium purpureum]|eukprot:XP_003284050.1 hypothetical protein DICPUDRAFT_147806 [Dictyostelium purpureum]
MKLLFTLLLLGIASNCCFASLANLANQFVNFEVFNDPKCQDPNPFYGVGFSIVTDTCLTFDEVSSNKFTVDGSVITYQTYYGVGIEICNQTKGYPMKYTVNSCIVSNGLTNKLNLWLTATGKQFFYKVSLSSKPLIQKNSMANVYMGESCQTDNILLAQIFVNGTYVNSNDKEMIYYCDSSNQPMSIFCPKNKPNCNAPTTNYATCEITPPFYNSSTYYTSSYTACQSGTCSGSGGSLTGSSGTSTGSSGSSTGGNSYKSFMGVSSSSNPNLSSYLTSGSSSGSSESQSKGSSSDSEERQYYYSNICY